MPFFSWLTLILLVSRISNKAVLEIVGFSPSLAGIVLSVMGFHFWGLLVKKHTQYCKGYSYGHTVSMPLSKGPIY